MGMNTHHDQTAEIGSMKEWFLYRWDEMAEMNARLDRILGVMGEVFKEKFALERIASRKHVPVYVEAGGFVNMTDGRINATRLTWRLTRRQ